MYVYEPVRSIGVVAPNELGSDRVESVFFGSPNRLALAGGGRISSRSASERELGVGMCGGRKRLDSVLSNAGADLLRKPR